MSIRWCVLCFIIFIAGCSVTGSSPPVSTVWEGFSKKEGDIKIISQWPDRVRETSGLALHSGLKWTINDSGDAPVVYALNSANKIEKVVRLEGVTNRDWESLAQDKDHLYIADCGNNRAKRSTVTIYKVSWSDLNANKEAVTPYAIKVTYADFADTKVGKNHNFDCEAITIVEGELWLFTKNRADLKTKLYRLSTELPTQVVMPSATYNVDGLITAADYDPITKQLALLGYGKNVIFGQSFVWIVPVEGLLVWDQAKRIKLNPYAQWEALIWDTSSAHSELILSSEKSPLLDVSVGRLFIAE